MMQPTTAFIDIQNMLHNIGVVRTCAPHCDLIAMVKANAYGHGVVEICKALSAAGIDKLGVATFEEGVFLRERGILGTILITAGANWMRGVKDLVHHQLTPWIASAEEVALLRETLRGSDKPFDVHLDVDTGMSRNGLYFRADHQSHVHTIRLLKETPALHVAAACTHFATPDAEDDHYLNEQIHLFVSALDYLATENICPKVIHASNSAAVLRGVNSSLSFLPTRFPNKTFWVRPGMMLYGVNPFLRDIAAPILRPILKWVAPVVVRKQIAKGSFAGYGCTWQAQRDTEIAVLGVGYGDGYHRLNSNRGQVLIAGRRAPIVGRVSMDMTVVDVSDIIEELGMGSCALGQMATLIGADEEDEITAVEVAEWCETISYEVLTTISQRVVRKYISTNIDY